MKREVKNALARRRILDGALREFSAKGYEGASLNNVCAENDISKGIIYYHYKDKNELYLLCVKECFDTVTKYLKEVLEGGEGTGEERLQNYFEARIRFFAENPLYFGIFADTVFRTPAELSGQISELRKEFDELNISTLTALLDGKPLRSGLSVPEIVEEFRMYMDFFNMRFKTSLCQGSSLEELLKEHEERCRQQIDVMLHGVLGE